MDAVLPKDNPDLDQQSIYLQSSDIHDVLGNPEIPPRLGDCYQAEIPPLITKSDSLWSKRFPTDVELTGNDPYDFSMGLDIPVMWVNEQWKQNRHEGDLSDKSSKVGYESDCIGARNEKLMKCKGKRFCLVPGSLGEQWSEMEEASLLLGLYIFGKNLVQVKKFIDSKNMGDILSFYYGRFYKSKEYHRWSDCRRIRSRRCVFGHKIFTGPRQQELLSRLLNHLSAECQNSLLEVSKSFGDGKILLEEYVTTLKTMAGLGNLVQAVGIGKGKQDLTGISGDSLKSNQVLPIGKPCSSLTYEEIVKLLTGDFRLSKARSRALFWEAVWPRLLARGWSSQQPKNHKCTVDSNSLVFLLPGVNSFSRRKLVKGTHYFDSLTDVLSKVASDPGLLELELEANIGDGIKEEYGLNIAAKVDKDDLHKESRHCYLQPRTTSTCLKNVMKYTVVDTSLSSKENPWVRELISLPFGSSNTRESRSRSEENGDDMSADTINELNSSDNLSYQKDKAELKTARSTLGKGVSYFAKEFEVSSSNGDVSVTTSDLGDTSGKSSKSQKAPNEKPLGRAAKRRRMKLTACMHEQPYNETGGQCCCSDNPDSGETVVSQVDPFQENVSFASSSGKASPVSEGIPSSRKEHPHEKPPEFDVVEHPMLEATKSQVAAIKRRSDSSAEHKISMDSKNVQQQPSMSSRRHSTRNRPLTIRALEAFACGFLSTRTNRKREEGGSPSLHKRDRTAKAEKG